MSNVLYECPEDDCATRAYAHPDGTLPNPRCGQHNKDMVMVGEPTVVFDPANYVEPKVLDEMPTSIDAVTQDGRIVGVEEGLGSPGHGIAAAKPVAKAPAKAPAK